MNYLGLDEDLLRNKGGFYAAMEIERQPLLWKQVIEDVEKNILSIEKFLEKIDFENTEIILCGAGSSALAASVVENTLRNKLSLDVKVVKSTELILQPEVYLKTDKTVLFVSYGSSGSTPESVEAVRLAQKLCKDYYQMFVLCSSKGIIPNQYKNDRTLYIPLPSNTKGNSFAATAEFTCLILQTLAIFDYKNIEDYKKFVDYAEKEARDIFENKIEMIKEISMLDTIAMTTVGSLEYEVLSAESALKAVEMTSGLFLSNNNSSIEYRHGPKLIMNSPILCLHYIYPDQLISKYDIDMMNEVATDHLKGTVIGVGFKQERKIETSYFFELSENDMVYKKPVLGTLLYALVMQALLVHISLKLGIKVDWPSTDEQVPKVANRVIIYRREELNGEN
ncbi:SIS domain-containing protein [Anaerorhabdus sp.]|uniref:SIS domain-containing protein n=1 Tax=Anaerorhabdus sp. TaxID=1872524 RepID=UPI002FC6CDF2